MGFLPKNWLNFSATGTKLNAAALQAMEDRAARYAGSDLSVGPGVFGLEDFRAKQRIAGANMSVDVGLVGVQNTVYVNADGLGGVQRYDLSSAAAQQNVSIAAADPANPRIDRIIAEAPINADDAAPRLRALTGTPAGGATLDNLTGAAAVAATQELLADVLVGAAAASILTANIRDRRRGAVIGTQGFNTVLTTGTTRDEVFLEPVQALGSIGAIALTPTTHDNQQVAILCRLNRRIVGATRIRFKYRQGATQATSNYNIGIADLSGRVLVSSGATAFTGAANAYVEPALTIAATTFEAGYYWVIIGLAALTASSAVAYRGPNLALSAGTPGPAFRQIAARASSGGTTLPTTLAGLTDVAAFSADTAMPHAPAVSLSVG